MSDRSDEQRPPGRAAAARDNSRILAVAILGGLGTVFAVVNRDEVEVNWIFGSGQTPLILVIVVSLLLGFLLGTLLARRRARR